jgi:hypothetical protein
MITVLTRRRLPWKTASQSSAVDAAFDPVSRMPVYQFLSRSSIHPRLLALWVIPRLDPVLRQDVELLQTIQAIAQFRFAKSNPFLPAGQMTHGLKDVSRQITFANQSFKIGKFTFKATQVSATVWNQIDQGANQEITLRSEPFPLTFVADPLVT